MALGTLKTEASSKALPMKKVKNLSRRLVSFPCNCGEYRHLPASCEISIPATDLVGNAMFEKLVKRGILKEIEGDTPAKAKSRISSSPKKERTSKPAPSKSRSASEKKSVKK